MKLSFSKMQALANDFIVINNLELQHKFSCEEISFLAKRKTGIGCDQVLLIEASDNQQSDFYYRIYNQDGSEASQCGNGARCVIAYIYKYALSQKAIIKLQTATRVISGRQVAPDMFEVEMGAVDFTPALIPLTAEHSDWYQFTQTSLPISFMALSVGNPHAVIFIEDANELDNSVKLSNIAKTLQQSMLFPQGVNVNFVYVASAKQILLRTYERGCGFTEACGSGAAASAVAAIKAKLAISPVQVLMAGGELLISWQFDQLLMTGTANYVFSGQLEL